jgi:putative transcription factor
LKILSFIGTACSTPKPGQSAKRTHFHSGFLRLTEPDKKKQTKIPAEKPKIYGDKAEKQETGACLVQCELCGSEQDSLNKIKLEGTKLKACDSCQTMGETVDNNSGGNSRKRSQTSKKSKTSSSSSRNRKSRAEKKKLHPKYGRKIKNARESEGITIESLSKKMNEKESRIRKIENQELKPDQDIGKKLQKHLSIEIYENPDALPNTDQKTDQRKATIGDLTD